MATQDKPVLRRRLIEGWRQVARRINENRARYRFRAPPPRIAEK